MKGKRGRPATKPEVEKLIRDISIKNRGLKRESVARLIEHNLDEMGEESPTQATLLRKISEYWNAPLDEEDELWSLESLPYFQISSESLPRELRICIKKINVKETEKPYHITIREAKWISRLAFIYPEDKDEVLFMAALDYARTELISRNKTFAFKDITDDLLVYQDMTGEYFSGLALEAFKKKANQADANNKQIQLKAKEGKDARSDHQEE